MGLCKVLHMAQPILSYCLSYCDFFPFFVIFRPRLHRFPPMSESFYSIFPGRRTKPYLAIFFICPAIWHVLNGVETLPKREWALDRPKVVPKTLAETNVCCHILLPAWHISYTALRPPSAKKRSRKDDGTIWAFTQLTFSPSVKLVHERMTGSRGIFAFWLQ